MNPTHKSPKNRYFVDMTLNDLKTRTSSGLSFGTMSISNLEQSDFYIRHKKIAEQNGGAYVIIRENRKQYPEFDWHIIRKYQI